MLIELQSGIHATFVTSTDASWFFPYERLEIFGQYCTVEAQEVEAVRYRSGLDASTRTEDYRDITHEVKMGFAEADRRFVDAILGESAPARNGDRWLSLGGTGVRVLPERSREAVHRVGLTCFLTMRLS